MIGILLGICLTLLVLICSFCFIMGMLGEVENKRTVIKVDGYFVEIDRENLKNI